MNTFFGFMASPAGRVTRIMAGLVLILIGLLALGGIWGWILSIVGLVPLLAGLFDRCVFAPLFGLPFMGSSLRQALQGKGKYADSIWAKEKDRFKFSKRSFLFLCRKTPKSSE